MAVLSTSQLQHDYVCRFLGTSDECAQTTEFVQNTTDDSHANQDHRRGEDQSRETQKYTQLSCRRPESPTAIDYRSGERARITMRPQTKYARSQGTPSPQISVTFGHFNYQPIICHRGPRPKAHWYMCADVANSQNHHSHVEAWCSSKTSDVATPAMSVAGEYIYIFQYII